MNIHICRTWEDSTAAREAMRKAQADWYAVSATPLFYAGYNNTTFDCPVVETHQRKDRLPLFGMDIRPYNSRNVVDVFAALTFNDNAGQQILRRTLTDLARFFGIDTPEDDIKGEDVAGYIAAGDYDTVACHCAEDVRMTAELYRIVNRAQPALVFDVETVALDNLDLTRIKGDSRLTDPAKVAADLKAKASKAALDPFGNRIAVLCWEIVEP